MTPHAQRPMRLFAAERELIPPGDEDDSLRSYSIPRAIEWPWPCQIRWHGSRCFYGPAAGPPVTQSE